MAFTEFYKSICKFGYIFIITNTSETGGIQTIPHNDTVYDASGTIKYYNKDIPCQYNMTYNTGSANLPWLTKMSDSNTSVNGWCFYKDAINPETFLAANKIPYANVSRLSTAYSDGKFTIHCAITNTADEDFNVNSVCYGWTFYVYSSSSATSPSASSIPMIYKNFDEPILVPANDTVLVDIILSAGDISEVSEG